MEAFVLGLVEDGGKLALPGDGLVDAPEVLLAFLLLEVHPLELAGEGAADEVVEAEGAVFDDEFPVVVVVVVEVPGGLAVVGVVGDEGAIRFKYGVLNLAQNVLEPELACKYYTAGLHSSTSCLADSSQVSRFMLG